MASDFDNAFFPTGFWPEGFWPQRYWPAPLGRIADWIALTLDGQQDPAGSLTLRVVRPHINDYALSHFVHADVFLCGVSERLESQTTEPNRFWQAMFKLHAVIRSLPAGTVADTMLSRAAETIRRLILGANSSGKACDGLAIRIDCPDVRFVPGPGFECAEVTTVATYCPE